MPGMAQRILQRLMAAPDEATASRRELVERLMAQSEEGDRSAAVRDLMTDSPMPFTLPGAAHSLMQRIMGRQGDYRGGMDRVGGSPSEMGMTGIEDALPAVLRRLYDLKLQNRRMVFPDLGQPTDDNEQGLMGRIEEMIMERNLPEEREPRVTVPPPPPVTELPGMVMDRLRTVLPIPEPEPEPGLMDRIGGAARDMYESLPDIDLERMMERVQDLNPLERESVMEEWQRRMAERLGWGR